MEGATWERGEWVSVQWRGSAGLRGGAVLDWVVVGGLVLGWGLRFGLGAGSLLGPYIYENWRFGALYWVWGYAGRVFLWFLVLECPGLSRSCVERFGVWERGWYKYRM